MATSRKIIEAETDENSYDRRNEAARFTEYQTWAAQSATADRGTHAKTLVARASDRLNQERG